MRFMMLMYPGESAEQGVTPSAELMAAMMKYNEEMTAAGVLLSLDGLQASSKGARVVCSEGRRSVTDGPFTESKEVLGGYWLIQVASKQEAIDWALRCPPHDCTIEVRQVFEMADFPDEVRDKTAEERVRAGLPSQK